MTNHNGRRYLSAVELDAVLSYVKTGADIARQKGTTRAVVDELIVLLLAAAGLRPHELSALRIRDLLRKHGQMTLWIRNTNSGISRKVDIPEDLAKQLTRFVRFYRNAAQQEDLLLTSERGGPLSYMSLYSKVRRIGREAGVGELSPAVLRRAYVHQLYQAEQDLRYVQEQAGYRSHRSIAEAIKTHQAAPASGAYLEKHTGSGWTDTEPEQPPTCEACGTIIAKGTGWRIESGQFLCNGCLKYFRRS